MLRAEAERVFRLKFLPMLHVRWQLANEKVYDFELTAEHDPQPHGQDSTMSIFKLTAFGPRRFRNSTASLPRTSGMSWSYKLSIIKSLTLTPVMRVGTASLVGTKCTQISKAIPWWGST